VDAPWCNVVLALGAASRSAVDLIGLEVRSSASSRGRGVTGAYQASASAIQKVLAVTCDDGLTIPSVCLAHWSLCYGSGKQLSVSAWLIVY